MRSLTPGRLALVVVAIIAGVFLWRYWKENQKPRQLYECKVQASNDVWVLRDCLRYRFGWDDRSVTEAYLEATRKTGR
jgi:hypothetical protein